MLAPDIALTWSLPLINNTDWKNTEPPTRQVVWLKCYWWLILIILFKVKGILSNKTAIEVWIVEKVCAGKEGDTHFLITGFDCWPHCSYSNLHVDLCMMIILNCSVLEAEVINMTQKFEFLKKLWCCVGGRLKQKFILSNELIKVEWPPWKIWKADVSSVSPSSERIEELWLL